MLFEIYTHPAFIILWFVFVVATIISAFEKE